MDGQGQEGEGGQRLEGTSLVGAFVDAIDLEDDEKQPEKRQVAQKRPQAAAAVFGLAGIEPLGGSPGSPSAWCAGRYCWWGTRFGLGRTEVWLLVPIRIAPLGISDRRPSCHAP